MKKKETTLRSFHKGLQIWALIAKNPEGMRLIDLAEQMDLPASNTTLYLNTLMDNDLVIRDPLTRRFFISPTAIELFSNARESMVHRLLPGSEKPMRTLHKKFNENVLLAAPKENTLQFLKHISSNHIMTIRIEPKPDYSMHITAAGRAILAFLPEKEINRYIETASFVTLTDKTVCSKTALREELQKTKELGYAFNSGEFESGIMAVAAPVIIDGRPVASLTVQFPMLRHTEEDAINAAPEIIKQANKIADRLPELA